MLTVPERDVQQAPSTDLGRAPGVDRDRYSDRRDVAYRVTQALYRIFGIIAGLVGMRLILRSFGVNPNTGFAALLYNITDPLVRPFTALLGTPRVEGAVFEPQSLVAIAMYALAGWVLGRVVWVVVGKAHAS